MPQTKNRRLFLPPVLASLGGEPFLLSFFHTDVLGFHIEVGRNFFAQNGHRFVGNEFDVAVKLKTSSGGNETSHDDVLLESAQIVHFTADRGFRKHACGFLERSGRDERLGGKRSLGDSQQQRTAGGRF